MLETVAGKENDAKLVKCQQSTVGHLLALSNESRHPDPTVFFFSNEIDSRSGRRFQKKYD